MKPSALGGPALGSGSPEQTTCFAMGLRFRVGIGVIVEVYWENGKENGNYYSMLGLYWDNGKNGNYYSMLGLYWDNGKENGNYRCLGAAPTSYDRQIEL